LNNADNEINSGIPNLIMDKVIPIIGIIIPKKTGYNFLLNNNTPTIMYINPNTRIPIVPGLSDIFKYSKMCSIPFSIRNIPAKERIAFMACIFKGLVIMQLLPTSLYPIKTFSSPTNEGC
jgi:hypothetical protein